MSHSKWAKTEVKKAKSDGQKSKVFTKLVKLIMLEAKKAAGNKESPLLKLAIEKARDADMPNENIGRALKRAVEEKGNLEKMIYEAYGPAGVGIIIEALSDNKNKAVQEIKYILTKGDAVLGAPGSVMWNFKKEGEQFVPQTTVTLTPEQKDILEKILDELLDNDEVQDVWTNSAL